MLAAAAVGLGAFGAHGLQDTLLELGHEADAVKRIDWFETGVHYHLYHALGILIAVLIAEFSRPTRWLRIAPLLFLIGILLFSGSLYAMALAPEGWRWLGAVVPLGGLAMIIGWIAVACGAMSLRAPS